MNSLPLPTLQASSDDEEDLAVRQPGQETSFSFFTWSDIPSHQKQRQLEISPSYIQHTKAKKLGSSQRHAVGSTSPILSFESLPLAISSDDSSGSSVSSNYYEKGVSFSDKIQVRTFAIAIGDHPYCKHLPLELGWEYNDKAEWSLNERQHPPLRRRTYFDRKKTLKLVSGMSNAQIRDAVISRLRNNVTPSAKTRFPLSADV